MNPGRTRTAGRGPLARLTATVLAAATLILGLTVVTAVSTATPAQALCSTPTIAGTWHNTDPDTPGIVRVEFRYSCSDTVICDGQTGVCSRPPARLDIRPFGSCVPTACDWGWRTTTEATNGWVRAQYHHSWATKDVWARTEVWYGHTYLRVWTYTDYTDGRTDFERNDWFLK